jgi:hypothetical protein
MMSLRISRLTRENQLIRRYELEVIDPTKPWKSWTATFTHHSDMWLRATKREQPLGV